MSSVKKKFSKILIAIDGSEQSLDAVDYAIDIAELYALYVVSSPTLYNVSSEMPDDQIPEEVRKIMQNAKEQSQPV